MFSTAIIIFREILEIAMILGIVLVATRGLPGRMKWIAGGFAGGLLGAGLVAVFAQSISESMAGMGQEFFNAGILFTAALMIGWTVLWMRGHAKELVHHIRQVGHGIKEGNLPFYSLSMVIGLAILREGSEIVMFIYGMALSGQSSSSIVAGSVIGVLLGTIVGVMLYYGLLKIPTRYMLTVTSWLLMLLVAGLASQGVGYLSAAGYFSEYSKPLWNTSWLLSEDGIFGKSLHSLIGYTARPTAAQVTIYLGTLLGLFSTVLIMDRGKKHAVAIVAAVFVCALALKPGQSFALDEIYSPNVEYGELSLEYNGSRTFDTHSDKNNAQEHEIALEAGLTPRWEMELSGGFAKDPDNAFKLEDLEIENRFQFFEQGQNWLDSGMLVAYDFSTISKEPDNLEVKLLLQKDVGKITNTANIGFDQAVAKNSGGTGGPDYVFLWNSRYRHDLNFQPGVEIQSDLGQGHYLGRFNDQEHYVGPAIWGELIPHLQYQVAYLFGVTQASSQSAARVLFEYEMHF